MTDKPAPLSADELRQVFDAYRRDCLSFGWADPAMTRDGAFNFSVDDHYGRGTLRLLATITLLQSNQRTPGTLEICSSCGRKPDGKCRGYDIPERQQQMCPVIKGRRELPVFDLIDNKLVPEPSPPTPSAKIYRLDPGECTYCDQHRDDPMMPPHEASSTCESGKRNHCTCDICY